MRRTFGWLGMALLLLSTGDRAAHAQNPDATKAAIAQAGVTALLKKLNPKLTMETSKNQCTFLSGSDVLEPGCDQKLKNLARAIVDAKKQLDASGVKSYRFVVSGHTDTPGNVAANKTLSEKRATTIVKSLVALGIPKAELRAIGRGGEAPLVKPDDTPAKKAKNRRYEIQIEV